MVLNFLGKVGDEKVSIKNWILRGNLTWIWFALKWKSNTEPYCRIWSTCPQHETERKTYPFHRIGVFKTNSPKSLLGVSSLSFNSTGTTRESFSSLSEVAVLSSPLDSAFISARRDSKGLLSCCPEIIGSWERKLSETRLALAYTLPLSKSQAAPAAIASCSQVRSYYRFNEFSITLRPIKDLLACKDFTMLCQNTPFHEKLIKENMVV